jgi:hypothetical protein
MTIFINRHNLVFMNLHGNGTMNTLLTIRGEIIGENVKILSFTVSTCSYLKPCYPGACQAECKCSEGFGGNGCRNCEYTMTYFYFTCFVFTVIILYIGDRRGIVVVVFTTNKTNRHNIAEILLKVASNTITHTHFIYMYI